MIQPESQWGVEGSRMLTIAKLPNKEIKTTCVLERLWVRWLHHLVIGQRDVED